MNQALFFSKSDQQLWLSPFKAIFWENRRSLILSDLHLGKTGHFRKAGIAIPQNIFKNDLHRLFHLVQHFNPDSLIVVGDFFHSTANKEADLFAKWRHDHGSLNIQLIKGNHDILSQNWYDDQKISLYENKLTEGPFSFVHEWNEILQDEPTYFFCGHIHPGVRISGAGRQSLRLPCFYFGKTHAILPAFGGFTGLATVTPERTTRVFAIANDTVIALQ